PAARSGREPSRLRDDRAGVRRTDARRLRPPVLVRRASPRRARRRWNSIGSPAGTLLVTEGRPVREGSPPGSGPGNGGFAHTGIRGLDDSRGEGAEPPGPPINRG